MITLYSDFPKRIVVLMLCYGREFVAGALNAVRVVCDEMFMGMPILQVVIDNSLKDFIFQEDGIWTISGDNSYLEFSGWDYGYKFLRDHDLINEGDLILFVNDTIHRRNYSVGGSAFLQAFNHNLIQGRDLSEVAIGYIDDFPRPVSLMGITYNKWIRSNIYFLPKKIVDMLHPFVFPLAQDYIFGRSDADFWNDIPEISHNWRAYISSWLFGIEDKNYQEYRLKWIKCTTLSESNSAFFKKKAVAILSEHYLAARLIQRGIDIIDANTYPRSPDRHLVPYYR